MAFYTSDFFASDPGTPVGPGGTPFSARGRPARGAASIPMVSTTPYLRPPIPPDGDESTLELPGASGARVDFTPMVSGGLIRAMIDKESSGRPDARGKAGERGLMQIMPATARRMGVPVEDLDNPQINVQTGTRLMDQLLRKYNGDLYKALMAYNAGEGAVDRGRVPPQAQAYAQDVMRRIGAQGPQMAAQLGVPQVLRRTDQQPTFTQRLGAAWGPGTAEASEGPPSSADIEKDIARRRAAAAPPGAPPAGPPDAAAAKAPWPVRAGAWLPTAGQFAGEYGAGAVALPAAIAAGAPTGGAGGLAVESGAMGLGGGAGYGLGELANRGIRSAYGYPNLPWRQEGVNTGIAAGTSAAMVPGLKALKGVLPETLKAGMAAKPEFQAAEQKAKGAVEQFAQKIQPELGGHWRLGGTNPIISDAATRIERNPAEASSMLSRLQARAAQAIQRGPTALANHFDGLREAVSTYILRAGERGENALQQLAFMRNSIAKLDDNVIHELFQTSKQEFQGIIDTSLREHSRWMARPDLRAALQHEMDSVPHALRQQIAHHQRWAQRWLLIRAMWAPITSAKEFLGMKLGLGAMLMGSKITNSPVAQRLYIALLRSQTAPQVRLIARALMNALFTGQMATQPEPGPGETGYGESTPDLSRLPEEKAPGGAASTPLPPLPESYPTEEIPSLGPGPGGP